VAAVLQIAQEHSLWGRIRQTEKRQWWLWASAIVVTLLLTIGMASFSYVFEQSDPQFSFTLRDSVRGLVALVFLFDLYTIYQQLQIHRIHRRLSQNEEMFRLITENADDLITVIARDGRRLYDSPSYLKTFGYTNEDLQGVPSADQIHPGDHAAIFAARREVFGKGVSVRVEYRFRHKDGEWRHMESTGSPVRNHKGEVENIIAVSRDITQRRQAEELLREREQQLRQAQKMEAVGRLSGGIAHDFNNLLGVIIGYSESIEHRLSTEDPLRKDAREIRKAGERAAALTHQLLAFSRQQVLQPKVLDLNAVVTDMSEMLRRLIGVNIELNTQLEPQLGYVKADKGQIEQIIVNLAVNARDAMPDGGRLLIETSNAYLDEPRARSLPFLRSGPHVLLTVTDTGIGMDQETLRHIFEPFFTTKGPGKGTGLGLATVYGVVKQSGGIVGVESEQGTGSKFKIYLPLAEESVLASAPEATGESDVTGTGTILLVDDEESLRKLTADVLAERGYTVLSAGDGIQALEIARSYIEPIHLLLTDLAMPRLGGPALARYMAHLRPETRVLFMTGHAERDTASQGALPAGTEALQKPFNKDSLIRQVRQALDAAPHPASNSSASVAVVVP
jgi:two-component system cell cycle sensor histidine kinase/response regulator CckA